MTATSGGLPTERGASEGPWSSDRRREAREPLVRQVDYTPFPRVLLAQRQRTGVTRNLSASGLCLRTEGAQPVGSLLRVVVHRADGQPALESVGRVAWCDAEGTDGCWMGLQLLATRSH
ncbi:MAG: PilZ domain-containing protein [Myxococcota bacterium]